MTVHYYKCTKCEVAYLPAFQPPSISCVICGGRLEIQPGHIQLNDTPPNLEDKPSK